METQNVTPDANGQYNVILGSTTATGLPDDLFSQQEQRWLGVQVQGEAEQARVLLVSVPYAFKAHEAETLGGMPASAFVKAPPSDTSASTSTGAGTAVNAVDTHTSRQAALQRQPLTPTAGYIPVFTSSTGALDDSLMSQLNVGRVDVSGNLNLSSATQAYLIGGFNALNFGNISIASTTGPSSLFVGVGAGASNLIGTNNTFAGSGAGAANESGKNNAFYGYHAGNQNDVDANSFFGSMAGAHNDAGVDNTFLGYKAGFVNTGGSDNTYIGYQAGLSNGQSASNNTFTGSNAGMSNVTGEENVFNGAQAGMDNNGGDHNTFIGYQAGKDNDDGNNNVFIGSMAGSVNTDGSGNTCVGAGINCAATNAVCLGSGTSCGGSNAICIGTGLGCSGNEISIGTTNTNAALIQGIWHHDATGEDIGVVCVGSTGHLGTSPCPVRDLQARQLLAAQQDQLQIQLQQIKAQRQEIDRLKLQLQQQNASLQERLQKLESYVATQMKVASDNSQRTAPIASGGSQ